MLTEEVLSHPCRALTEGQRRAYFDDGAVLVEGAIGAAWLDRLRAASAEAVDRARRLRESKLMLFFMKQLSKLFNL